ncbi:hypothetical protein CK203_059087 [Vitis vinifera]|uniref:RNase H type-1 domain-containing protein n=1 Tax=Vitis vinifera TaxID=29760 RepID=A0A438GTS2_VITVI|nr:hypothetical protein CK203_059087 [Vitis vinifera]
MPSPDITRFPWLRLTRKNNIHNAIRPLLLQSHAIRTQKRWRHLSETDDKDLQTSNRPHGRGWSNGWTDSCQNALKRSNIVLRSRPSEQSRSKRKIVHISGCIGVDNQRCSISLPLTQGAETNLLRQQRLTDVETRYSKMELTALALRSSAQKLRPYFQAHPGGRADRSAPSQHFAQAKFNRQNAVVGYRIERIWNRIPTQVVHERQVMTDFVLEYSQRPNQHQESNEKEWWTLRVDGASRSSRSGVGLLLQSPTGEHLEQAIRLGFPTSNNEAEYEAILSGLDLALALSVSKLRVYSDSQLVVRHIQEEYEAKDARMAQYLTKVKDTLQQFTEWTVEKIRRTENGRADALAGIAASLPIKEAILLPIHVQTDPSGRRNLHLQHH